MTTCTKNIKGKVLISMKEMILMSETYKIISGSVIPSL
jgi:hypothetical protein